MTFEQSMKRLEEIIAKMEKNELSLEETMKLYQKYNVNPMGGCLPLLIQMPILLAVYGVIQNPITYILKQRKKSQAQRQEEELIFETYERAVGL